MKFRSAMPLEVPDQKRLIAAVGYLELGMYQNANEELERIEPEVRHLPEVLLVRMEVYQQAKAWDLMAVVAKRLVVLFPEQSGHWADWAYATRRAESLAAAKLILEEALDAHPSDALILYNLACYGCQLGSMDSAREHLKRCFAVDQEYRLTALDDPDLEPLWASLGERL